MAQRVDPQWLRFGSELRTYREQAGLSQEQLAKMVAISPAMLSAIERGTRGAKREYPPRFDQALSTGGQLEALWERLRKKVGPPLWFHGMLEAERAASEILEYQPLLIPGLLQTEEYAWTIMRDGRPKDSHVEVEGLVKARIERQTILAADHPPLLRAVIEENVLHRPLGGRAVMGRQLAHLVQVSELPTVSIQVVPHNTEHHPGLSGPSTVITVPDKGEILYLENRISGAPIDEPDVVTEYLRLFGDLRGIALSPAASRDLIESVQGEFQ